MERTPLLVFVPDSTGHRKSVQALADFLESKSPFTGGHKTLICDFELPWFSNHGGDLKQVAEVVASKINGYYTNNASTISRIILCGYSLGAMLVRRAFLDASGFGSPSGQRQSWADAVERIVLVGAICRGFHYRRLPLRHRVPLWLAARVGLAKALRSAFVGEPWASNVRLDWITYWRDHDIRPLVVNIRGDRDNLVYDGDAEDVEKDPRAVYVRVEGANHNSIVEPTKNNQGLLLEAFAGNPRGREVSAPEPKKRVYLLLHGMRSSKHFMNELAERLDNGDKAVKVITPDVGYISLLCFLSPS